LSGGHPFPDFIIGGAPRSGTTYLCEALDRHPDIYIPRPYIPESKVFLIPHPEGLSYRERYANLFAEAREERFFGDKTSYYLENAEACRLIRENLGPVKMIFIVREPVARAYSNWLWSRKNGLETLGFEEAVEKEGRRESPFGPERAYVRPFDYLSRGDYFTFAKRYYAAFGRESVGFFLFEDIIRRTDVLLNDIQAYIGVDPLPSRQLDPGVINPARDTGPPIDPALEAKLRKRFESTVDRFAQLTGLDVSLWGY
jgi:hypothetical protein